MNTQKHDAIKLTNSLPSLYSTADRPFHSPEAPAAVLLLLLPPRGEPDGLVVVMMAVVDEKEVVVPLLLLLLPPRGAPGDSVVEAVLEVEEETAGLAAARPEDSPAELPDISAVCPAAVRPAPNHPLDPAPTSPKQE